VKAWVAEPPARYLQRPPAVVDASVLAAVLFLEPEAEQARTLLLPFHLHAPTLLPYELANVAANKLRRDEVPAPALAACLAEWGVTLVDLTEVPPDGAFELAARWRLTAYDAAYLWLAAELRVPLLTFDRRLGEAAVEHMKTLGAS
jgi:predicted nucleic acid-binding protein